jgi:hypothetical protein
MRPVDRSHLREAIQECRALLAQWTDEWDKEPGDWWHICCDQKDYSLDQLKKMVRYDVRRGLQECEVRRTDGEWFADHGYSVYAAAFQHYGTPPPLTEDQFRQEFRRHALYPGRETWGAFVSGRLVAWESCLVIDDAAILASAKSDPAFFKARPNNALLYVLTRHYLRERRLAYVMSGSRVLRHETNVQGFNEKMGYRKIFCPLRIQLRPMTAALNALRLPVWARRLAVRRFFRDPLEKLEAIAKAVQISRP